MSYGTVNAPPMGYIRFVSDDPHFAFTARLGDSVPQVTNGYAKWTIKPRPRKRGLTHWDGSELLQMDIPILFDNFRAGESVEDDIRELEKMAGLDATLSDDEPPLVVFHSNGVVMNDLHDASQNEYVVTNITWGDADRNRYGNRVRAACTVEVTLYSADDVLGKSSAFKNRKRKSTKKKGKRGAKHKTHHVKSGETLSTIARDELGDAKRWREIAAKNPRNGRARRDPKAVKINETLKMP